MTSRCTSNISFEDRDKKSKTGHLFRRHDALPTFLLKTEIRKVKQDTFFDIFTLPDFYCDKNSILNIECYDHTYAKFLGEESI